MICGLKVPDSDIIITHANGVNMSIESNNVVNTDKFNADIIRHLKELDEPDNEGFFRNLVQSFAENAQRTYSLMQFAIDKSDWDSLRKSAHKLKGSSSSLGCRVLADACSDLEEKSASSSTELLKLLVHRIGEELKIAEDHLRGFLPRH